jgi:CheY-like chemotaxis protein
LIVDDEQDFGTVLQEALADGYEVEALLDGATALRRLFAGERFDLILCDLMMPWMDGIEFHRRLVATVPEQAGRIVFMSGGATTGRIESFFRRVPNIVIQKPLDLEGLRALIDRRVHGDAGAAADR